MLNQCQIAGYLGKDPEGLKYVGADNTAVTDFSLALGDKRGGKDIVTWVDVTAWGKTAENVVKYLQKGSGCIVVGRLTRDEWKAQDGSKRTKLKVTASFVRFFPKSANAGGGERPQAQAQPEARPAQDPAPDDDYNLDDIPF